ncbi:hypothetical protein DCS_05540 [Drechmeria coniospora]|uniref:Cell wall galactomannoprotein n=1 Tax=Drechmeria coniospora TaxID=98403 RepID=A0A151GN40_DRECN|nr:hypothetical protein DCS_05540 [Drechmeria coniospora]KYK58523.1 hypothetical protein DCS_05540 [Drechmeria coniospora]
MKFIGTILCATCALASAVDVARIPGFERLGDFAKTAGHGKPAAAQALLQVRRVTRSLTETNEAFDKETFATDSDRLAKTIKTSTEIVQDPASYSNTQRSGLLGPTIGIEIEFSILRTKLDGMKTDIEKNGSCQLVRETLDTIASRLSNLAEAINAMVQGDVMALQTSVLLRLLEKIKQDFAAEHCKDSSEKA